MNTQLPNLSLVYKVMLTFFLIVMGLSYLFATVNLQLNVSRADGEGGFASIRDIQYTYRGNPNTTLLETMIHGPMEEYLPFPEAALDIEQWIDDGKTREGYEDIRWIFDENCVRCHSEDGEASFRLLTDYEHVAAAATPQKRSIASLARFSHFHAFGFGLFSLALAGVFSLSTYPRWARLVGCSLPFVATLMDIGSWWLTRLVSPWFAYTVFAGGLLMGVAFAVLIPGSLFDMWRPRSTPQ